MAINMPPKHGGGASCGQAGDSAKHNLVPQSMVDWYWIRLFLASNSGGHPKIGWWADITRTLDATSCPSSDDDAGCQMNDRSSELWPCGTLAIAGAWRPYDEPAMPKSRECMGRDSLEARLGEQGEAQACCACFWWDKLFSLLGGSMLILSSSDSNAYDRDHRLEH